jgi:hypothetical protein
VQHLAGVSPAGQQRVIAKGPGVAVGGAALVVAVDLADGGVHVDGHRLGPRSGASGPRPGKDLLGGLVELADVAEGERAQERAQGRWRQDSVAQHLSGLGGAEHVGVVDAVTAGHHRMDQGQHLAARPMPARAVAEVNQSVDDVLDSQPLGQRGGQHQPGVGDRVVVVEPNHQAVETVGGWHRESALLIGINGRLSNAILPAQRAFLIINSSHPPTGTRWIQA